VLKFEGLDQRALGSAEFQVANKRNSRTLRSNCFLQERLLLSRKTCGRRHSPSVLRRSAKQFVLLPVSRDKPAILNGASAQTGAELTLLAITGHSDD